MLADAGEVALRRARMWFSLRAGRPMGSDWEQSFACNKWRAARGQKASASATLLSRNSFQVIDLE